MSNEDESSYGLRINSIGSALPASTALLSDALSCSPELISRAVYTAPSQLFSSLDYVTAEKAYDVLSKLGFDVEVTQGKSESETKKVLFDVAVFLSSPFDLSKIVKELSVFLGLQETQVQNMLMAFPPLVLGHVSQSTVDAISNRVPEAQVIAYNPNEGIYYARLINVKKERISDIASENCHQIVDDVFIEGLTFEQTKRIWKQFPGKCQVIHHLLLRAELVVLNVDHSNAKAIDYLINRVGMPEDFVNTIDAHLPLKLYEPRSFSVLKNEHAHLKNIGIDCELIPLWEDFSNLHLISVSPQKVDAVNKILKTFFEGEYSLSKTKQFDRDILHVFSEKPTLLNYFAEELLSQNGCDVKVEPCMKLEINHFKRLDFHENTA